MVPAGWPMGPVGGTGANRFHHPQKSRGLFLFFFIFLFPHSFSSSLVVELNEGVEEGPGIQGRGGPAAAGPVTCE